MRLLLVRSLLPNYLLMTLFGLYLSGCGGATPKLTELQKEYNQEKKEDSSSSDAKNNKTEDSPNSAQDQKTANPQKKQLRIPKNRDSRPAPQKMT